MPKLVTVSAVVEGNLDEAVVKRLIEHIGGQPGTVYGKKGKPALLQRLKGYNNAAQRAPWVVLVDLDNDADCAPLLRQKCLPDPAPSMCFRIAVRQVEAWLMADAETLADELGVRTSAIPTHPEALPDAKQMMVDLARQSRRQAIRDDMTPRPGSGRSAGPAYTSRLIEYARTHWRPDVAAQRSDSLLRAITCLQRMVKGTK